MSLSQGTDISTGDTLGCCPTHIGEELLTTSSRFGIRIAALPAGLETSVSYVTLEPPEPRVFHLPMGMFKLCFIYTISLKFL